MNAQLKQFIIERKMLFWSVEDPTVLSLESVVETILNYGNWQDFQILLSIAGQEKVATIFAKETEAKKIRTNYRPEVKNYFKLYFHKYAR